MLEKQPRFISIIGYPAVGKSAYAATLKNEDILVISGDDICKEVMQHYSLTTMDEAHQNHYEEVVAIMRQRIQAALSQGKNVAVDAFNTSRKRRQFDLSAAKQSPHHYRCEAVIVHPPEEDVHAKRLLDRIFFEHETNTAEGLFLAKLEANYEAPTHEEGFDSISEVGTRPKKPMMRM